MSCNELAGQCIIKGVVRDEQGQSIEGCVVFLLHESTLLLEDNTLTDKQGQYQVMASKPGNYILEFNNLSFWDTSFQVMVGEQSDITLNTEMRAKIYDLQVVEIIDKLLGIRRSGDTLFYNINAYADGSELVVEDLLKKLPGIGISPTGQVSYMGKTVDALLLDGNDLAGSHHMEITQNVLFENVGRVQVIENYIGEFDAHSLSGEIEKVAMNIELKKDKKGTTIGNISLGGGYHNKYKLKVNALKSAPKLGFSLFSGSSNYKRDFQPEDKLTAYSQYQMYSLGTQRFGFIEYEIYTGEYPEVKFTDHFFRMTETNRMNTRWSRRSFLDLTMGLAKSQNQTSKLRFADQSTEQSFQSQANSNFSFRIDHDTKFQVSPKWRVIAKAEGRMIFPQRALKDAGTVNGLVYFLNSDSEKRFQQLNLEGLAEWSLNELHTLKFYSNYSHISFRSDWFIIADKMVFGFSTIDSAGKYNISYRDRYDQNRKSLGAEWTWTPMFAEFAFFGRQTFVRENLNVQFINASFNDEVEFDLPLYEAGVKATFKINHLKVSSDITLSRPGPDKKGQRVPYRLLPAVKIRRDIGKFSVLSLQVLRQEWRPGLLYLHQLPLLLDHHTMVPYGLVPEQNISTWNASLFLQRKPGSYKSAFIANISGSWSDKTLVTQESMQENNYLREVGFLPSNRIYRLMVLGWHTADKWKINFSHFSVHTAGHSVLGDLEVKQENLWIRTVLGFAFNGFAGYELSFTPELQFQQQHVGEIVTNWINPILSFSVGHKSSKWEYTFDISQNINRSQNQNLKVQVLNFSIGFRKWMPFRMYIEGANVLNLLSNRSLTANINPVYTETVLSESIPGSILLIGRFDF